MRPLRLDAEGFTAFREPCVVDFTDAEFFVLVGPTGSGKSTLLDAICFALYGTVPRWADQRSVAGALSPSGSRARVRLAFEIAGSRYVAARVVTRDTKGRAKTTLAGLQRLPDSVDPAALGEAGYDADAVLGEVLAATPKEMESAVPALLGLPYEHFTTCVLLPQGAFARFLHAKPSERGDILVNLLGLHVYRRIATRAGEVARESAAREQTAAQLLASHGELDRAAVDGAAGRVSALAELRERVDAKAPALAAALTARDDARARLDQLNAAVAELGAVRPPADVGTVAGRVSEAATTLATAETELAAAEAAEDKARTGVEQGPDPTELRKVLDTFDQVAQLDAAHAELTTALDGVAQQATSARDDDRAAGERLEAAELALAEAQRGELVGALRPHLAVGEPCPVCEQPVRAKPAAVEATALRQAEKDLAAVRTQRASADRRLREAEQQLTTVRARLEDCAGRLAQAREAIAGQGDRQAVAERLRGAEALRSALAPVSLARDAARQAWSAFDAGRDTLAAYHPPAADRDDLDAAWSALTSWAQAQAAERTDQRADHQTAVRAAEAEAAEVRARLRELLREHDLAAPDEADAAGLATAVAVAHAQAEAERDRLAGELELIASQREERDRYAREERVAKALADHLRANNFERWLLREALDDLVDAASRILSELSGGQYELGHADGEFWVLDHHDADLRRGVRTLSGGETFQASLALALALSDQLASMSQTATSLESILLDEGFGTLDASTLETVAATLENLSARGDRVVGLVTHVPALAERVPVRFEVTKDAHGSHVERVG